MNLQDVAQRDIFDLIVFFILIIWAVVFTIGSVRKGKKITSLIEDKKVLREISRQDTIALSKARTTLANRMQQCDRLEAEKKTLKEQIELLKNKSNSKDDFKSHMKVAETKPTAKVDKNSPSREKGGRFKSSSHDE